MSKRFSSTEIWDEDWFIDMPLEYKLFWFYMLSSCNHAGLFKVNLRSFCGLNEVKINTEKSLQLFNIGKNRIRVVTETLWYIEDFFVFQYGDSFNVNNRVHNSIKNELIKVGVKLGSIRGLKEFNDTLKDKDKDKDIKEGGVGETIPLPSVPGWNTKPLPKDIPELPKEKIQAAIENIYHTKAFMPDVSQVLGLFKSWVVVNVNGIKFYNNVEEVYTHFHRSLKNERFDKANNNGQQPKIDNRWSKK